jgi:hypothetical protein
MVVRVSSRKRRKTEEDGKKGEVIKILGMKRSLNEVMKFSHNIAVMQICVPNFLSSLSERFLSFSE